jgi:hypothetical protein
MSLGLGIANELLETPTDWTPIDENLGTPLQLWLQNGVGVDPSGSAWIDSSNKQNTAEQATEANRPTSAVGGMNFDQSSTLANHEQYLDLENSIQVAENEAFSLFFVVRLDELTNETIISDSNSEFVEILRENQFRFKGNVPGAKTTVLKTDSTPFTTGIMAVSLIRPSSGSEFEWYVNGNYIELNASTTNAANSAGFDFQNIGSRNDNDRFLDGVLYELLFYTTDLTNFTLTRMHTYLKNKFNIS